MPGRRILLRRAASAGLVLLVALTASVFDAVTVAARIRGISPSSGTVEAGRATSATVSIDPPSETSFLTASGLPQGASVSFDPNPVADTTSTMTVQTSPSTPEGDYTITVFERDAGGAEKDRQPWSLRVNAPPPPPPPPPTTTTTAPPPTTAAPTTTAPPATTTTTAPTTTTSTTTTAKPTTTTTAVPVPRFAPVARLSEEPLPARVLFLPFASRAYRACLPLTGFCGDPDGGVMVLPADDFAIEWVAESGSQARSRPRVGDDDLDTVAAVGTTPDGGDGDNVLALPIIRADGSIGAVERGIERDRRGDAQLTSPAPRRGRRLAPEADGPDLQDATPPPGSAPFGVPAIVSSGDLDDEVPVLVAVRGSVVVVYAIEAVDQWNLNRRLIPVLGGGALPHLARGSDGRIGLAVPVPAGLVVPGPKTEAVSDTGGFDLASVTVPLALILGALAAALGLTRLFPLARRRRRRCECAVEYRWVGGEMIVNWLGPTDAGRTHAGRPFPLAATANGFHVVNASSNCRHGCGQTPGPRSARRFAVAARTHVSWQILSGGGGFLAVEDTVRSPSADGEQVLFQPPELELGEARDVKVRVEASSADPAHPGQRRADSIEVTIGLRRIAAGVLEVEVERPPGRALAPVDVLEERGECPIAVGWKAGRLSGRVEPLPEDGFVAAGDHVRLTAAGAGVSELVLSSEEGHCTPVPVVLPIEDAVTYEWSATAGSFPAGARAASVVYQAPEDAGDVTLTVTIRPAPDEAEKEPVVLSWDLEVCALGVGLENPPADWLPDPCDGRISITARTYRQQGGRWITPGRRRIMAFHLEDVSAERGVCMNFPAADHASRNPDLFFAETGNPAYHLDDDGTLDALCPTEILTADDNPAHRFHYQSATGQEPVTETQVVVRCEDFGAFGHLVVRATDCVSLDHGSAPGVAGRIAIPRDDNRNSIADGASHDADGAPGVTDDDDAPAGDGTGGDGFTNYEEYRGFVVGGGTEGRRHVRTEIGRKDVFVHDEHNLGVGHFTATGLTVHILRDPSLYDGHGSRVVNFNRGHATGGEQHGIRLVRETLYGPRQRATGGPGTPGQIELVAIDTAAILAEGIQGMGDRSRAHGLAHAVSIAHHGEPAKHFDCGPHTEAAGGETSGAVDCVMRYTEYAAGWCHDSHDRHEHPVPDVVGDRFCASPEGTGSNDSGAGHRNDASRGNCVGQLRVKDW